MKRLLARLGLCVLALIVAAPAAFAQQCGAAHPLANTKWSGTIRSANLTIQIDSVGPDGGGHGPHASGRARAVNENDTFTKN